MTSPRSSPQRRRGLEIWIGRVLLGLIAGLLALIALGAVYQAIATKNDQRRFPPPGRLVDVGGYRLHINCVGEGSPTVILESGLATMSADWANVQPAVAKTTRVCVYDRAGTGWSDPGPTPRDPRQIARELHALLDNAGIPGPYVLAGQSFGGLCVRMYANQYPNEVAGIVLVDASHPDQWSRIPPEVTAAQIPPDWQIRLAPYLARLGILRITMGDLDDCGLPIQQCKEEQAYLASTRYRTIWGQELLEPSRDAQVRATGDFGDKPLAVLIAGDHRDLAPEVAPTAQAEFERVWRQLQNDLAALSTNSTHLVVEGATHSSLQFDQEDAQLTSAAIVRVVEAVRNHQPLTR
jgi:pimeloyl-ACP methyl ester carboxylesterase